MIIVREDKDGTITPIGGNPVLTSLDGTRKATLRTILHASWSAEDRAAFGVQLVEPVAVPAGKRAIGETRFTKRDGRIIAEQDLADLPAPRPINEGAEAALETWAAGLDLSLDDVAAVLMRRGKIGRR